MKKILKQFLFLGGFFFLSFSQYAGAQMTIIGPQCATNGLVCQYIISGITAGAASTQICISGGVIASTDSTCYNGVPVGYIRVKWNNVTNGSITISGAAGSATLSVNITKLLSGGIIDSLTRNQVIRTGNIPPLISCSSANGGNCSTTYSYQWQSATDGLHWTDMNGATAKDLQITALLTQTMYYRRKVAESSSVNQNYSGIAMVTVLP